MSSQYPVLDNRPIDQWKVTELKDELRRRMLPIKGLKEELVRRLSEAISDEGDAVNGKVLDNGSNPDCHSQSKCDEEEKTTLLDGDSEVMKNSDGRTSLDSTNLVEDDINNEHMSTTTNAKDIEAIQSCSDEILVDEPAVVISMEDSATNSRNQVTISDSSNEGDVVTGKLLDNCSNPDSRSQRKCDKEEKTTLLGGDPEAVKSSDERTNLGRTNLVEDDSNNECILTSTSAKDMEATQSISDGILVVESAVDVIPMEDSVDNSQNSVMKLDLSNDDPQNEDGEDSKGPKLSQPNNLVSDISQLESCSEAPKVKEHEDSKLIVKDIAIYPVEPNNQVSEVSPDLGFQLKSESVSTESISFNEKHILKDNLNSDNFHLELDTVNQETAKPTTSFVPSATGDDEQLLDVGKELVKNSTVLEGVDVSDATTDLDLMKKSESDGGSSEKLILDGSPGDESMDEDAPESKDLESINNEVVEKNEAATISAVEGKKPDDVSFCRLTSVKMNVAAEADMKSATLTEKRKLEESQPVRINGVPKRQRRWNSENVKVEAEKPNKKVPEVERSSISALITATDSVHPTPKRSLTRSNSGLSEDSLKERVVPLSQKPATTSLRIDRFLRPFTLKAVQELLAKHGTICYFWMDNIKSHCYATYSSVEEAIAARNALYNLKWPTNGGKLLVADFVEPQEVKARVATTSQSVPPVTPSPVIPPHCSQQQTLQPPLTPPPPLQNPPLKEHLPRPPPPRLPEPPVVTLDDLFKKTKTTPKIYYLPLSEEEVTAKLAARRGASLRE